LAAQKENQGIHPAGTELDTYLSEDFDPLIPDIMEYWKVFSYYNFRSMQVDFQFCPELLRIILLTVLPAQPLNVLLVGEEIY